MKTVLITGANRGLGLEFAKQYQLDEWEVIACCRNPDDVPELLESGVSVSQLNLLDFEAINRFAETLKGKPIDLLINNAGIHDRSKEEGFLGIETERWIDGFKVNAMAPVLLTQALVDNLSASENPVAATIGSQAGCLTLYDSGGLYLYRTSKAAAHSATVILSNDLKTLGIPYVCLRPGHTKTDMGGSDAPYEIDESVRMMRQTLAKVDISQTGCFIDRTGELIPWNMEKDLNI
ncbi:SDR family oxidoreductase [Candidatus Pelagisphaera phototrophica]|uniref:SDR family oxidoreductase n=1 Tax=Candidatus Pelagisphaera phototrophica TaxID=2684113 RepID=UPI0019EEA32D|nr:SDR family oxidoreductase [Candidatus Pelagisphaera phototrophica]QXD30591.1 SDR family oxidoreductase [Candidatus Pelagisphaera phototrophica]